MTEYTLGAGLAAAAALWADRLLSTGLSTRRAFWIFWLVMAVLLTLVDGYLTWRPIVRYGEAYYLGLRLFTIPFEDFLFGFALITSNLVVWEYFSRTHKD